MELLQRHECENIRKKLSEHLPSDVYMYEWAGTGQLSTYEP